MRGPVAAEVQARIDETATRIRGLPGIDLLGPAVPAVARVLGLHRRHLLAKADGPGDVARVLARLKSAPRPRGKVEEIWDVDPVGVL